MPKGQNSHKNMPKLQNFRTIFETIPKDVRSRARQWSQGLGVHKFVLKKPKPVLQWRSVPQWRMHCLVVQPVAAPPRPT